MTRDVPQEALDLIAHFEGFRPAAYQDPAGYPTIGIGHLIKPGEEFDEPMSREDAQAQLQKDLGEAKHWVHRLTRVPMSDGQYGALVSFVFNVGSGNYQRSTLRMRLNRGEYAGAASEFRWWRRAGGRILAGLVRRRAAERKLFLRDITWH